jgi:hypothetical protein
MLCSRNVYKISSRLVLVFLACAVAAGSLSAQQADEPTSKAASTNGSKSAPADSGKQAGTQSQAEATSSATEAVDAGDKNSDGAQKEDEKEVIKLPPPPPKSGPKVPFEMQRYEVELPIVFEPSAKLGSDVRQSIMEELRSLIDRSIGPMWVVQVVESDWITPRSRVGLERLTPEQLKQRAVELRIVQAVREQLSEYTEGAFPVHADAAPTDEMLKDVRAILAMTGEPAILEPAVATFVEKVAAGQVPPEKVATVSEVVFLYLSPAPLTIDKVFPVSVEVTGGSYVISAREWDRESELLAAVHTRTTIDRRTIAAQILRLLSEVFRPVVQIDEATPRTARIRYKAGEYPPGDPAFVQATQDSMYIPFFRYLDRNKVVQQIQFLPWSYITAKNVERTRADCDLDTGVKTPLGSFKRRRMDLRALALKPYTQQTTLTLVPKRNRTRPLVGYLVAVYDEIPPPPPEDGEEPTEDAPEREKPDIYRSDRFGNVTIPVDPKKPLQWVFIRSGSALLAKFPMVAGAELQMTVECPDDTIRLDVEGQIVLLQSRLVDTIAKQAMVKAMITNRLKKGEWKKVDESLKELDELPTIKSFESMVSEIQYPALKKAEERRDRSSQTRIKTLGEAVLKVARIHLDQEKVDEFREDVVEQRRLEDPDAPKGNRAAPGRD